MNKEPAAVVTRHRLSAAESRSLHDMTNVHNPRRRNQTKVARDAFRLLLNDTQRRVAAGVRSADTLDMQRQHARYLLERLGPRFPLRGLTSRKVAAVLAAEQKGRRELAGGVVRPLSGGTVRKRASTLRQALAVSRSRGWLQRLPTFPEIPYRYTPRAVHLPDLAAYRRLRDALPRARRLWFVVAVWTGQRLSDVERMRREDLDCDERWVRVRSTKTRRFDGVRIHATTELVRELEDHWRQLPAGAPLVPSWPRVSNDLAKACARVGLPRMTAHSLRHTLMTWYVAANGFTPELLELGGWRDLTIPALVYAHAAPPRLREQLERMATSLRRAPRKIARESEREPTTAGNSADGSGGGAVDAAPPPEPAQGDHAMPEQDGGAAA